MDQHQKFEKYITKHLNRIDTSTNKSDMMMYTRFFLIYLLINKKYWKDDNIKFIKNIRKCLAKCIKNKDVISFLKKSDSENNVLNYIYGECSYKTVNNTLCKNKVKYGNISCWVHKRQIKRGLLKEKDPKCEGMLMMVNQSRYELGKPPIRGMYKNKWSYRNIYK